ncbi:hypothetical protein [Pseudomonas sp. P42]|uniref:hypothetical protein n=1 Tax=Pseudomonas sp. P42 TaxID=1080160 RepID=UPI001E3431DB|nr:hypothetical protein [Pseudomonas sp. P42]
MQPSRGGDEFKVTDHIKKVKARWRHVALNFTARRHRAKTAAIRFAGKSPNAQETTGQ